MSSTIIPSANGLICRMADGELPADEPQAIQNLPQFKDLPFTGKQVRIALRNCGLIDPEKIEEYIARDGYRALGQVLDRVVARGSHPRSQGIRPARPRRRRVSHRHRNGNCAANRPATPNTSSATPTKAIPARSWTARFSKAIRTPCSKAWPSPATRWARAKASSIAARNIRWPSTRLQDAIAQANELGLLGDKHPRHQLQLRHLAQGRRRRVCLRRRNRAHCLHRRPARRTASASAVPRRQRPLGQAQQHQQRQELRHDAADHPAAARRGSTASAAPNRPAPRSSRSPARSTTPA